MKFMHISDLHLGKNVRGFSMLEDQRSLLRQVITHAAQEKVDALLIAGDVYDKHFPSEEAVALLDDFINEVSEQGITVLMIAGNHDSRVRLQFGHRLFRKGGVHIVGSLQEACTPVTMEDAYGPVHIYLLPFVKPAYVRAFLDQEIESQQQAVEAMIEQMQIDPGERNLLVAHQFVAGAATCDSESALASVGGLDAVPVLSFSSFDYVALGHLHSPQAMGRETIRYSGSLMKYSLSEAHQKKTMVIVDMKEKGEITLSQIPFRPLHDLREIKGTYDELMQRGIGDADAQDYVYIALTDEQMIPDAKARLQVVYPNIMELRYENLRYAYQQELKQTLAAQSDLEWIEELYELQNNQRMETEQRELIMELLEKRKESL